MLKRVVCVFVLLVIAFTGMGMRIADININVRQVSNASAGMSIDIVSLRGTIYDCKMRPLTNGENEIYAAAKPTNTAIAQLKDNLVPEVFESVKERMAMGKPVAVKTDSPLTETDDIHVFCVPNRYYKNSLACHVIGYLDGEKRGISGIEKVYDELLTRNCSTVRVRFSASANGRVMLGEDITVEGNNIPKNGVALTIDKEIQQITETALDNSGAECAAAVVVEIENGAIRACVSRPIFDQNSIAESLNNDNSPLINRAFLPFSVGSVFKPVVAAAAMESGVDGFKYNCTGSATYNGVTFNCHKDSGHGVLNMQDAVAYSCNTYFIALAIEIGAKTITETAEKFGFGVESIFADGLKSAAGKLPSAGELDSKAALANLSFGQGSLLATPVQICSMMAAIARGGIYVQPYLIAGEVDADGKITEIKNYREKRQIVSQGTAERLMKYLEKVVEYGSGTRAESNIVTVAGKTATAQTGKEENGEEIYNAWFAGYFPAENPKYAVAVLKENGGEGALSCAPVFKDIAEAITILEHYIP